MQKYQLDEIKNLSASFDYDDHIPEIYNHNKSVLNEETFDDFDTVYEAMRSGLESEIKHFIFDLLSNNFANFLWSFTNPKSETFSHAWEHAVTKYNLRDDNSRDQFLERMRILLRNIFLNHYNINGEDQTVDMADKYFLVLKAAIEELSDYGPKPEGQSTEPAQSVSGTELTYR
jgi:hypothetical protein